MLSKIWIHLYMIFKSQWVLSEQAHMLHLKQINIYLCIYNYEYFTVSFNTEM